LLTWVGTSINTMVLAGVGIAPGGLGGDAIIDGEEIVGRGRVHREAGKPPASFHGGLEASPGGGAAAVCARPLLVLVFLAVFFLEGLAGAFFRPLALAYVLAILASLAVALTVTPGLAYLLLTDSWLTRSIERIRGLLAPVAANILPLRLLLRFVLPSNTDP